MEIRIANECDIDGWMNLTMKKVLMIVGSMREKSFNRQLAGKVAELLKEKAEVSFLNYAEIPYMNQDNLWCEQCREL